MPYLQNLTSNLLDILTKAALALLTAVMAVMLIQHHRDFSNAAAENGGYEEELRQLEARNAQDKLTYQEVAALFEQQQYAPAMEKLKAVQAAHPDNPRSLLWQARLQYELGMSVESIDSYRQAIDREPDFVDKKSPLFELQIIKQLKQRIDESKEKLNRESILKPGDSSIKKALGDLLYLQRRIAGGCE